MNRSFLQSSIDRGLLTVLLLFPVSINFGWFASEDASHPLLSINVSLADLIIFAVFVLWILKIALYREWKTIKWPPAPVFAFVGFGALSFIHASSTGEWAKELIKIVEYFLVLYLLLVNNLRSVPLRSIIRMFFLTTTVILLVAFIQHMFLKEDEYRIRGMFANNNVLGIYLCMAVPLIYSRLINSTDFRIKTWMGGLLLLAFMVLLSGSALLSIVISLLLITVISGQRRLLAAYCIIIVLAGAFYALVMPARNVRAVKDFGSLYEEGSISQNYLRRLQAVELFNRITLVQKAFGNKIFLIGGDLYLNKSVVPDVQGQMLKDVAGVRHIKNRYLEMQASLNLLAENTALGLGLGNYQNNIGKYYISFPKINTSEPNADNGYLVIASTSGILGLSAFLWIFFQAIKNCRKAYRLTIGKEKALFLGLLGSLTAILIENFFSNLLTASLLVPLIFLLYLTSKNIFHADYQG